ncbi:MAG: DUF4178 domain-containing protein [Proteobacteria bacterium]|nr:DUF4178 domain-containing protein [Pseudomonadota bacterium]
MQKVSCPSCGAEVAFKSTASVLAVCEFCKTTILKDADSVKNLGKMSDVLEDYSPIQIGTSGVFGDQAFNVIGRIQLRYPAGMWNEWYVLFDDGKAAWLSDASGMYTLTQERPASADTQLPTFEELQPARNYALAGMNYVGADIRTAECIGGQGELPFKVGKGWQARVADFRAGANFLTLDYSDADIPAVYTGQAVTLEGLKCQLLRDEDQVKTSAGKFKGKVDALSCPSCGSSVSFLPGVTTTILCPSCHAQVDAAGPKAEVLQAATRMSQVATTLELGAKADINGKPFEIIGLMQRADDENTSWTEYLLYSARGGFLWLVETDAGWERSTVLDEWPGWFKEESVAYGKATYQKLYRYPATVTFAAGAFNWRVNVGDQTDIIEYEAGQKKLAAEITAEELNWSQSLPVSPDQIRAWFGDKIAADKEEAPDGLEDISTKFIWWIIGLNAIPLFFAMGDTFVPTLMALAAVYLPAKAISWLKG